MELKSRGRKSKFTLEQRLAIVAEYERGTLTSKEIAAKYGFKSCSVVLNWRKRLQNADKSLRNSEQSRTYAFEISPQAADDVSMEKRTAEELEAEVKRLTKELEWAKLQNKALNTLIDIAEEQGIRIRKKSGAKQ